MNEAQKRPANRCFSGSVQKPQKPKAKEEQIRNLLLEAKRNEDAERQLSNLLKQFHGKKSLLQLLPVIRLRFPHLLSVAIERVENRKDRLKIDDQIFFESFKLSLNSR